MLSRTNAEKEVLAKNLRDGKNCLVAVASSHVIIEASGEYESKLQKYLTEKKIVSRIQQQSRIAEEG